VSAGLGEDGWANEFERSDRVDSSSSCVAGRTVSPAPNEHALPDDVLQRPGASRRQAPGRDLTSVFCALGSTTALWDGTEPLAHATGTGADHAHLAIDGKTLGGTTSQPHPVHQLSCYEVATGIVLWHCNVQEKENEISALKPRLSPQLIKGHIFTLDAMHTQRLLCAQIHRFEGEYLLLAKDNQPTLHEDIAALFEDRTPDRRRWKQAETWDKGHGRLEHRHITCSPDLNDWFAKDWQGIECIASR
jgi:predicted transposase YbfD/YdcC